MAELFTDDQWRADAKAKLLAMGSIGLSGPKGLAKALVMTARILKSTPMTLLSAKGYVDRGQLTAAVDAAETRLLADNFAVVIPDDTVATLFLKLASQLKALDSVHHTLVGVREPFVPSRDWRVTHDLGEDYLIPRGGLYRAGKAKAGKQVAIKWRDLMPRHRLLPTAIDGVAIELHWRHLKGAWPQQAQLAAGFFEDLEFIENRDDRSFVVTDVACPDQAGKIASLVQQSHEAQAAVLILPELTMPPERVEALVDVLRERNWVSTQPRPAPGLIVAGSWHVPAGNGAFKNLAPVLDAYGEPVLSHAKLFAYNDDGIPERLAPGDTIHVLVTEDALISFGICLDFCHRGDGAVFPRLDVDFMLVTSCGGDNTMSGHIRTAQDMVEVCRGRAFVVQYAHDEVAERNGTAPLGYVLSPSNPKAQTLTSTMTNAPFSLHHAD